jgi:hypothetical protein
MWHTIERPGYFGKHRDERYAEYDARFGSGNWKVAWQIGAAVHDMLGATALYEDAYLAFLIANPDVCDLLVAEASDVYDDDPSNVTCGLDYTAQETSRTHLQDIAVRRSLVRMGRWFAGETLIRIRDSRGDHPLSMTLSPGRVPFHRPELIVQPELTGWWLPGSVEGFYQSNKVLQVLV